jgi:hypothetical protein
MRPTRRIVTAGCMLALCSTGFFTPSAAAQTSCDPSVANICLPPDWASSGDEICALVGGPIVVYLPGDPRLPDADFDGIACEPENWRPIDQFG